jgi:hypothetical protein
MSSAIGADYTDPVEPDTDFEEAYLEWLESLSIWERFHYWRLRLKFRRRARRR